MKYDFIGLTWREVEDSRAKHGSNELTPHDVEGFWEKLFGNFKDPIIIILVVALIITVILAIFGFAAWYEGVGIALAVLLATSVATWSEHKNETSFQKLQEEASRIKVNVFRDGHISEIFINDVVVGDHVLLQPGDKIPADGRILTGNLKVNQASLTGESEPIEKTPAPTEYIPKEKNNLSDPYLIFRGSVVDDGEVVMLVDTVGDGTEYGQLAKELSSEERDTPLQVKLSGLADGISKFGYIGGTLIALAFLFKNVVMDNHFEAAEILRYISNWQVFVHDAVTAVILAVIIIVVAVPEGLPMMIAVVLSLNMRKLLHDKILVRKLLGIETAGSLNILFSDKTGTITKNQEEVSLFMSGNANAYKPFDSIPEKLRSLLSFSLRENTECVIDMSVTSKEKVFGGNRVDRSLVKYIHMTLSEDSNFTALDTIPFDSTRKFSATYVKENNNAKCLTLAKGAPEIILQNCDYYYDDNGNATLFNIKSTFTEKVDELSERSMRIVAVATSEGICIDDYSCPLQRVLVGIIGIRDELRDESIPAIAQAQKAGIQVVMVTGDKKETAVAIANDAGLLKDSKDIVLTSSELNQLSDEQLKELLPNLRVVARAHPRDKSRLVKISQELDLVVGMTGDGPNDAPALNKSDVGFAMGSGSEVAKEAADIVIHDDNFFSVIKSILYGRTIFNSIRKFIVFQLTVNVAAILIAFLGPFLGYDLPFTMIQLLWVNLVMDTLAALAFGGEAALPRYMDEKPKRRDENIISKDMWSSILLNGVVIAILGIFFLKYSPIKTLFHSEAAFLTGFFAFFIFLNNFNKFNARTEKINLFEHILDNKGFLKVVCLIFGVQIIFTYFGGDVLRTVGLTFNEWIYVVVFSAIIIPIDLSRKLLRDYLLTKGVSPTGQNI